MGFRSLQASVNGLDACSPFGIHNISNNLGIMEIPKLARNPNPQPWPPLRCPRCNSTNTKFCYFNNYSKSQPRYLCKGCRRHWTEGGTLRDVPIGGGRKNKRSKTTTHRATTPTTAAAGSCSSNSLGTSNSSSLIQQLLNGNPSSSGLFPEILRQALFRPPPPSLPLSSLPLPLPTLSTDYGMMNSLAGLNHTTNTNSSSYLSFRETGLGGVSTAPPAQLGAEYWGNWDEEVSGLVDPEIKLPTTSKGS